MWMGWIGVNPIRSLATVTLPPTNSCNPRERLYFGQYDRYTDDIDYLITTYEGEQLQQGDYEITVDVSSDTWTATARSPSDPIMIRVSREEPLNDLSID